MDDKGHKRMRHEILEDISRYNIGGGSGGGSASTKQIPAGCHLDIRPATSHLFLGQPVEVEVRLLDDEDVVQPTTVGINVTVANEDNKVLPNQPDKFQLTPTRPALLDGTGTFQLILGPGSVRTGTRVKIHVEACAGGVEVKAHSSPLMVCRSALNVVRQPPENWYKDEGGRNNCIDIEVQVRVKTPGSPQSGQPQPNIPLNLALVYESGTEVHTQDILEVQANTHLVTNETGRAQLKFKITEVSQRHQSQKFRVKISPDVRTCPVARDVAPVVTIPVQVLSKRKNRKLRGERQPTQGGHSPVYSPLNSGFSGRMSTTSAVASASLSPASHWSPPTPSMGRMHSPMYPSSAAPPAPASHSHPHQQAQAHAIPLPQQHQPSHPHPHPQQQQQPPPQPLPIYQSPSQADPPLRVPLKDATGSLHEIFKWADAVLQLLQMELQWEHIGYEREEDGTVSYSRPLWRCPVCRTCKGSDHPHQKHSMDCRLGGLLTEFKDTKEIFGVAAREHAVGTAAMAVAKGGGVTSTGRSGNGSGNGNGGSGNGGHGGGGGAPGGGGSGGGTSGSSGGVGGGGGRGGIGSPTRPGFAHMNGPSRDPKRGNSEMDRLIGETTMEQTLANMPDGVSMGDIDRREYLPSSYSRGAPLPGHPQHSTEPPPHLTTLYHGITAGLSHFFSNLQANSSLEGMPRQRSVALFVPRRTSLTPAEERAYFIMLQSADNGAGGGGGGGSGKRLTVFSKTGRLLGFYEDKWEREQVHLLFLDVDNENCISDAVKESLESKLDAAIEEDDETRNGAAASGGDGGRGRNREAMETDDMDNGIVAPPDAGGDDSGAAGIRRRPPGPSSKPSISRPGTPGVKQEFSGGGVGEAGGRSRGRGGASFGAGARGVYRLSDFKDYHEMKEKAFLDSLGSIDTSGVFEPAAGGPLGSMRGFIMKERSASARASAWRSTAWANITFTWTALITGALAVVSWKLYWLVIKTTWYSISKS